MRYFVFGSKYKQTNWNSNWIQGASTALSLGGLDIKISKHAFASQGLSKIHWVSSFGFYLNFPQSLSKIHKPNLYWNYQSSDRRYGQTLKQAHIHTPTHTQTHTHTSLTKQVCESLKKPINYE